MVIFAVGKVWKKVKSRDKVSEKSKNLEISGNRHGNPGLIYEGHLDSTLHDRFPQ